MTERVERWQRCPSTHCERWQECRSPRGCIIHMFDKPELTVVPRASGEKARVQIGPEIAPHSR